jgi:hypothetical protein
VANSTHNVPEGYLADPDLLATLKAVGFPPGSWVWQATPYNNNEGQGWVVYHDQKHYAAVGDPHVVVTVPGSRYPQWMVHHNIAGWKPK